MLVRSWIQCCGMALVLASRNATAGECKGATDIARLIDQLVEVSEPGFGYSVFFSGTEFLPYAGTGQWTTGVLGAMQATPSRTLKKIVERGADAVPLLVAHLDDQRKIKMPPVTGMMWWEYSDEYDFNRRTARHPPQGVNSALLAAEREAAEADEADMPDGSIPEADLPEDEIPSEAEPRPDHHALTVGDLCFVALGQILNRQFIASRYQASGGAIVNSPTHSQALRDAIRAEWSKFDRRRHLKSLIADFTFPDNSERQIGAYYRLAYYFPQVLERLVIDQLAKPVVDAFAAEDFCRHTLYATEDADQRRRAFDEFTQRHGSAWRIDIEQRLFDDLEWLRVARNDPQREEFVVRPDQLLHELFGRRKPVRVADRPRDYVNYAHDRSELIAAMTHDRSRGIGDAVKGLLCRAGDDAELVESCLRCLGRRGYVDTLLAQLNAIDVRPRMTNQVNCRRIVAIAESRDPRVRGRLLELVKKTSSESYLVAALPAIDRQLDPLILERARSILKNMPDDTREGYGLLTVVAERFPNESQEIFKEFLSKGSARRAATMCLVLWSGRGPARILLAPLLDDRRPLEGFTVPTRVCDRAAQAITNTVAEIVFNPEGDTATKDRQIERLKNYCRQWAEKHASPHPDQTNANNRDAAD